MTPHEMAERLARIALRLPAGTTQSLLDSSELSEIIACLRRQPTDAQKIEALELAATQAELGVHRRGQSANHRKALRLLGLAHELGPLGESGEHGLPRCR